MSVARCSSSRADRAAFSIPLVLLFCALMVLLLVSFVQTRINMKQQTRITFRQLKAHYLAQSGVQHALLKLRVLPLESYDAAAVSRGICPFLGPTDVAPNVPPPAGGDIILKEFVSDVTTDPAFSATFNYPISFPEFANWQYRPVEIKALSAEKEGDTLVHSIEIKVDGELNENFKGVALTTTDEVTRVVKITRSR